MTKRKSFVVATVLGARPQFIKAAPVSRSFAENGVTERLIHTGQHYSSALSGNIWDELDLPQPWQNLEIGSMPHGKQTGRMLEAIEASLIDLRPDWVLVYGDTNSTLAGALAASKMGIPLVHVEAGLRSFVRTMPEEINRVLTDHVSDLLLTPTEVADQNLIREGIDLGRIHRVGDVMFDAALMFADKAAAAGVTLDKFGVSSKDYVLATVHRAENTDDSVVLESILRGLAQIAEQTPVLLPIHPRTQAALDRHNLYMAAGKVLLIEPVSYLEMLLLEQNALLIATDSGGVQKEAFFFEVPCVTLRLETEWTETVSLGANSLVNPKDHEHVSNVIADGLRKGWAADTSNTKIYGDGTAANMIVQTILNEKL